MHHRMKEIMGRAVAELRAALKEEGKLVEGEEWDPGAWEEEVVRFTRELGQRMAQTWGEVKAEQAKAQAPFVPSAGKSPTCTGGRPSGGQGSSAGWQWRRPICVVPRATAASGPSTG